MVRKVGKLEYSLNQVAIPKSMARRVVVDDEPTDHLNPMTR